MCTSSWFSLFNEREKLIFFFATISLGWDEWSFTLPSKSNKNYWRNWPSESLCFLCEPPANGSSAVHEPIHVVAHLRVTSSWALVAKKQHSVISEIYIMKRCCFSWWNKYVARLTARETGWGDVLFLSVFHMPWWRHFKLWNTHLAAGIVLKQLKSALYQLNSAFIVKDIYSHWTRTWNLESSLSE